MTTPNYILGLDLGTNSIGWALLAIDETNRPHGYVDGGVRIFPKAVEDKTPTPKNVNRRTQRLARRLIQRRARRKKRLENFLVSKQLLPRSLSDPTMRESVLNDLGNPYRLRAAALDVPLEPHQLGRVLLHMAQRRGFQSNRKTLLKELLDDPDAADIIEELDNNQKTALDAEDSEFKEAIAQLQDAIDHSGKRTLGAYLYSLGEGECQRNRHHCNRDLRTSREMYREEFHQIREKQEPHFAHDISSDEWDEIYRIIFFQRPLRVSSGRRGTCEFESRRPRAHRARLEFQRFRYLQDVNQLRYFEGYANDYIPLSTEQRDKLARELERRPELTWAQTRKVVGLDRTQKFNLEQNDVKKLIGNRTACAIREVIHDQWDELDESVQRDLVEDLLTTINKKTLKERLHKHWRFSPQHSVRLAIVELEPEYGSLSLKAITRILPHLRDGLIYSDAVRAAGYQVRQRAIDANQIVDRLPAPPDTRNPVVNKALHELRKLVNALIKRYGRPAAIRVEMARELKMNRKQLSAQRRQQNANTKANESAREAFKSIHRNSHPSRNDLVKYRLWQDQRQVCAYSGQAIPLSYLFSDSVEVDHIYPYRQSVDDSYINKVVCLSGENRFKADRTPWQAYSNNPERWEQITQMAKRLADGGRALKAKAECILYKGDLGELDGFINNQLVDTRYMSRVALSYLKPLGCDITPVKGQATAWLRRQWGLTRILGSSDEKDRTDHRHHLIDAAVIALTDRALYQRIARLAQREDVNGLKDVDVSPPWKGFETDTNALIQNSVVSFVPAWKISGSLHEDFASGFVREKDGRISTVYRKRLDPHFRPANVAKIVDPHIKETVQRHLEKYDNKPGIAFS